MEISECYVSSREGRVHWVEREGETVALPSPYFDPVERPCGKVSWALVFDDVSRSAYQLRLREEAAARTGCQVERAEVTGG